MTIDPIKIELASYASWVAFEQIDRRGWMIRFTDGYTKRNNSVNVIVPRNGSLSEMISFCESFYASRDQPTIFRLLSFVDNSLLDAKLADMGYSFIAPSLVLYQNIKTVYDDYGHRLVLDRETWLEIYCDISGIDRESQKTHSQILSLIPDSSLFAILLDKNQPVACALGIIQQECFGIFDLVTKKAMRNKGYGTNLMKSMMAWAKHSGIQHCYLQVTAQNTPAISLYEKLGYRYLYHYWYRIQRS